jgi:hypothetical protein
MASLVYVPIIHTRIQLTREKGYASIFEGGLRMCLPVNEEIEIGDRTSQPDFLGLDIYGDLDHMPLDLRCAMIHSIRVTNHVGCKELVHLSVTTRSSRPARYEPLVTTCSFNLSAPRGEPILGCPATLRFLSPN